MRFDAPGWLNLTELHIEDDAERRAIREADGIKTRTGVDPYDASGIAMEALQ